MYCEMCGTRVDDDSVFCENCGTRIEETQGENPETADDLEELMNMDKGSEYSEASEKTMIFRKPLDESKAADLEEEPEAIEEGEELPEDQASAQERFFEQEEPKAASEEMKALKEEEEQQDSAQADEAQEGLPLQKPRAADLREPELWGELQEERDMWLETETWKSEELEQEPAWQQASESESWAEKWGNGPEGSSSWDRGMTNTDEWLQEEIERTMRSLQQSSDHFVYEDRSGTILQGDPELFDGEDEEYDKRGQADDADKGEEVPENVSLDEEPLAGDFNRREDTGAFEEPEPASSAVSFGGLKTQGDLSEDTEYTAQQKLPSDLKVKPISFPLPDPPLKPDEKKTRPLFCMVCGKVLPAGAAFCQVCGTPTGAVAPGAASGKAGAGMGIGLLKSFFKKPAGTIERAAADEGFLSGIGFFLIKDVIIAVLAALLTERVSAVAGAFSGWLLTDDPFAFSAKIFLCGIVLDALWVAALWAAGKLFQADCSVKALIGACGTAGIFTAVLFLITILLAAFVPAAAGCGLAVTGAVTLIAMVKAASAALKLREDQMMFHMAAAAACYSIVLFALLKLCQ